MLSKLCAWPPRFGLLQPFLGGLFAFRQRLGSSRHSLALLFGPTCCRVQQGVRRVDSGQALHEPGIFMPPVPAKLIGRSFVDPGHHAPMFWGRLSGPYEARDCSVLATSQQNLNRIDPAQPSSLPRRCKPSLPKGLKW
jgi:hypothetical protein